jgi:Fic family protein
VIERARRTQADEAQQRETETRLAGQKLAGGADLNSRQHALVAHALKQPAHRHTLREHARTHRLSRQTARNDFNDLVRLGYFEEAKSGKALVFFAVSNFAEKIATPLDSIT